MVDINGLANFFGQKYNETFESMDSYASGSQIGSLDILLHRAKRNKHITQSKLWDYIQVENDPNFARKSVENKFEGLISKLSMTTSIVTIFTSQLYMVGIHEYIPANIKELLFNYNSIVDTGINLLNTFEKQIIFNQIEQALFADLEIQFLGGTITFNEIVNTADSIIANMPFKDAIENNGIRPLLSLGIQNLLPESMVGIFDALQYLDLLDTVFINDDANKILFDKAVRDRITNYGKTITGTVVTSEKYKGVTIDYADPLGLTLRDNFLSDLYGEYEKELANIIVDEGVTFGLSTNDIDSMTDIFIKDAKNNVDSLNNGSLGLPSLIRSAKGIETVTFNKTVEAMLKGHERFADSIITQAGLNSTPSNTRPLDYLINVKKNIEARAKFKSRGANSDQFVEINNYLKSVVKDKNISDDVLEDLNIRLDELLKERNP